MLHTFTVAQSIGGYVDDLDLSLYQPSAKKPDGSYNAPGFMGIFRTGRFQEFDQPGTFVWTVPADITKVRVRVVGRGFIGTYRSGYNTSYGSAGGYAHGVFDVTPGENFNIKVPSLRYNTLSEASFGNAARGTLIRATNSVGRATPGIGYGGDYQSTGGFTGASSDTSHCGMGASGTQVSKNGGNGTVSSYGNEVAGGGVGGNAFKLTGKPGYAGGAAGNAVSGANGPGVSLSGLALPPGFPRFKFDGFWGAGESGNPGAGGTNTNKVAGVGGGCHASYVAPDGTVIYGAAPIKSIAMSITSNGSSDARGLVIVEF